MNSVLPQQQTTYALVRPFKCVQLICTIVVFIRGKSRFSHKEDHLMTFKVYPIHNSILPNTQATIVRNPVCASNNNADLSSLLAFNVVL